MTTLTKLLPTLWLAGCVSDFSPDPYKTSGYGLTQDAGKQAVSDASRPVVRSDAGSPSRNTPRDTPPEDPSPTSEREPPAAAGNACDLSGRWIMTERSMSSALGARQLTLAWFYLELAQQGDEVTMTSALMCGGSTAGYPPFVVKMDDTKAWPTYMSSRQYDGRKGTSAASGDGCAVAFDRAVFLRGATPSAYEDTSVPLPSVDQPASDAQPGWEDWDGDGKPGVTMKVSGALTGSLYTVTRTWGEARGTIARSASSFTLPYNWGQERTNLGYDGSPLLTSAAGKDPDATQHIVELTRLDASEALGDDAAKCAAIRELAPVLTPNAIAQ